MSSRASIEIIIDPASTYLLSRATQGRSVDPIPTQADEERDFRDIAVYNLFETFFRATLLTIKPAVYYGTYVTDSLCFD